MRTRVPSLPSPASIGQRKRLRYSRTDRISFAKANRLGASGIKRSIRIRYEMKLGGVREISISLGRETLIPVTIPLTAAGFAVATQRSAIFDRSSRSSAIPLSAFGAIRPFIIYVLIYYNRSSQLRLIRTVCGETPVSLFLALSFSLVRLSSLPPPLLSLVSSSEDSLSRSTLLFRAYRVQYARCWRKREEEERES